jgi:hypothetical protein
MVTVTLSLLSSLFISIGILENTYGRGFQNSIQHLLIQTTITTESTNTTVKIILLPHFHLVKMIELEVML